MMTHWFSKNDIQKILANKRVIVIGDSVQRAVYKDLVCLSTCNQLLKIKDLRKKGEDSFEGDQLLEGGNKDGLKNVKYKEVRKFTKGNTVIMFYFVTRCYGEYMRSIIATFETEPPDVVIMNSCLWDLSRYGRNANLEFEKNINELLEAIGLVMPYGSKRMFIWNATLPVVDSSIRSCVPFDVPQDFRPENRNIRNANVYVCEQMIDYGDHFIFLDLYDIFSCHLNHRVHDGVHWDDFAHRKITCFLLAEISKRWDFEWPVQEKVSRRSPCDPRRAIRPSLTSIPSIGGRRSLGVVPNHSRSPYQRPSPRPINQNYHAPQRLPVANPLYNPFPATLRPCMLRQNLLEATQSIPRPRQISLEYRPRLQTPYTLARPLVRPFAPRPFGGRPRHFGTSWLNTCNGFLPNPSLNTLLNIAFPPTVRKRRLEEV